MDSTTVNEVNSYCAGGVLESLVNAKRTMEREMTASPIAAKFNFFIVLKGLMVSLLCEFMITLLPAPNVD
jgi:hypothetical protein